MNLGEFHKELPDIIEPVYSMTDPNQKIPIHQGDFILRQENLEILMTGSIQFDWFPSFSVVFSGTFLKNSTSNLNDLLKTKNSLQLIIDGLKFGDCYITSSSFGNRQNTLITGTLISETVLGDKSVPVNKLTFGVPNLRDFYGLTVKKVDGTTVHTYDARMVFEDDEYIITIDKHLDFREKKKLLNSRGGYILLFSGELVKKKGDILLSNSDDVLYCFSNFLSFLNGRRTSPLFRKGFVNGELVWCDYSGYIVDSYKAAISWPPKFSIDNLSLLWQNFRKTWKEDGSKDFLISAIHWYIEANSNSGYTEGSLIMAQTALELIYNWLLIEKKKIIIGKDSENLSAANKIRLLLLQLNASYDVPVSYENLKAYTLQNKDIIDGPDVITNIRNAIVHSQEEKRKKLSKINDSVRHEALGLSIWYVELSLLYILNYQGKYHNRCSNEEEQNIPWANK
jgi:hypothetical protein